MVASATQLNSVGTALASDPDVHAMTDVTGFGLLGHTLEMCRGAGLPARIDADGVPLLEGAAELARAGLATGAASRNWASYGAQVSGIEGLPTWQSGLLCDPQTSGGLLIAVSAGGVAGVLERLRQAGFAQASVGGAMLAAGEAATGEPGAVHLRP